MATAWRILERLGLPCAVQPAKMPATALATTQSVITVSQPWSARPALARRLALPAAGHTRAGRQCTRSLIVVQAAGAPGLLARLFGQRRAEGAAAAAARQQLLEQLDSSRPNKDAISDACDALMAAEVLFKESDLGGGPWQVVYTRGPLLWQGPLTPRGGRVASPTGNQASQDFDPRTRRVVNRGELLGQRLSVTASGSYEPTDAATKCPKLVKASIDGGSLQAWGAQIPLPIRGSGLVYVAYLDSSLRIFRATNGSISVQIRQQELPRLLQAYQPQK